MRSSCVTIFLLIISIGYYLVMIDSLTKAQENRRNCPNEYVPVCGNFGEIATGIFYNKTFDSQCELCAIKEQNPNIYFALKYTGICRDNAPNPCYCPRIWRPECGTNGVTYGNNCTRICAAVTQSDPCILLQHEGECSK